MAIPEPELLTVAEFCRRYSMAKASFYRLRKRGDIKAIKVGTATRIHRAEAERWLASVVEGA